MGYRFIAIGNEQRCIAIGAQALIGSARDSMAGRKA
jgi:hypothetical protein